MVAVSPTEASSLAKNAYDVNDTFFVKAFLKKYDFLSGESNSIGQLKADVGARLINKRDGFGICVRGSNQYKNDLFMIFRGTTGTNYGAVRSRGLQS